MIAVGVRAHTFVPFAAYGYDYVRPSASDDYGMAWHEMAMRVRSSPGSCEAHGHAAKISQPVPLPNRKRGMEPKPWPFEKFVRWLGLAVMLCNQDCVREANSVVYQNPLLGRAVRIVWLPKLFLEQIKQPRPTH